MHGTQQSASSLKFVNVGLGYLVGEAATQKLMCGLFQTQLVVLLRGRFDGKFEGEWGPQKVTTGTLKKLTRHSRIKRCDKIANVCYECTVDFCSTLINAAENVSSLKKGRSLTGE